jgi:hypothetical protein
VRELFAALLRSTVLSHFMSSQSKAVSSMSRSSQACQSFPDQHGRLPNSLRASVFVESLAQAEVELREAGWTVDGALGSGASLLATDPDGNILEFVENPGT